MKHSQSLDSLQPLKVRMLASSQSMGMRQASSRQNRNPSLNTMMGKLSLNDHRTHNGLSKRNQVVSPSEQGAPIPAPDTISLRSSTSQDDGALGRNSRKPIAQVKATARREDSRASNVAPPKTPHANEAVRQVLHDFEICLLASTRKYTESPHKSPSKVRPFLTKDSNLRTFTAWDVDERLIEVEAQFKTMKEVMNVSLSDKKAMEEVIELAKSRGKLLHCETESFNLLSSMMGLTPLQLMI